MRNAPNRLGRNHARSGSTAPLNQERVAAGLDYSRLWSDKVKTSLLLYLSSYRLNAVNFDILNDQRLIQKNEILDAGVKFDTRISLNNNFEVYSGYQFNEIGVTNLEDLNNPDFRRLVKDVLRYHAIFTETTFDSNSGNTNTRAGVRVNYFEKFSKVIIEPRFIFANVSAEKRPRVAETRGVCTETTSACASKSSNGTCSACRRASISGSARTTSK